MENVEALSVPEPITVAAHIVIPIETLKTEIQSLWAAFKQNGLELAPRLYQLQIELSSPGVKDEGFKAWLKDAGIPRSTAYRLIKGHMKQMGLLPVVPEPATVSQVGQGAETEKTAEPVADPEPEIPQLIPGEVESSYKTFRKNLWGREGKLEEDLNGLIRSMARYINPAEGKEEECIRIWNYIISLREEEKRILNDRRRKVIKSLKDAKEQLQRVQEGWRPLECLVEAFAAQEAQAAEGVN
jgi:hypothetical protein